MVVDLNDVVPFFQWLFGSNWKNGALLYWLVTVAIVTGIATLIALLVAMALTWAGRGHQIDGAVVARAVDDLLHMSPRRVSALAWLSIKESIRRRVVIVFIVFIVILSFAGWFLDPGSINPDGST